jgi:hypothetical protein
MYEVRERLLAVDRDDRDALAVTVLEVRLAGDVDLFELERHVRADSFEHAPRALAQVTTWCVVERDPMDRGHA